MDVRVTLLEAVSVMITLEQSRTAGVPNPSGAQTRTGWGAAHVTRRNMGAVGPSGCGRDLFDESPHAEGLPHFFRGRLRECFAMTLRERCWAKTVHDSVGEDRAWKAFALVPMMGRALRVDRFSRGEWLTLLEDARGNMPKLQSGEVSLDVTAEQQRRGKAAQSRVERARQELTGATFAPKTDETLRAMQGRRPQGRIREILVEVLTRESSRF